MREGGRFRTRRYVNVSLMFSVLSCFPFQQSFFITVLVSMFPMSAPSPIKSFVFPLSIHSPRCSPFQSLTPLRHFPFPCSPFRTHSLLGRSPFQSPSSIRSFMFPYSSFQLPPPPPNRSPFPGSAFSCSPFQRPLLSVFLFPVSVSPF